MGDFELMRVPDPESEMSCEQYGEVASVLTENMHYTGHVWVSFPTQLRCNWKSEPGIERVMSAPFEFELTLIGGDDTSERIWADYLRNVDRFPERIVRQESTLVESLGGVIYEGSAIVDRPERESMQMDLPGVSVSALTKCMEEYLNADGTACANMPAGFTSENKVQVLERVAETIATFQ